ncbi:MAG: retron system putative HNH endonuclease [Bacteroidota bacterium]
MIKIVKDLEDVPDSLQFPDDEFFPDGIPKTSRTTHTRRLEIIDNSAYIDETKYNNRYKKRDVKEALANIYENKCAFCEQKVEQYHVEHYRPKKIYYWIAFSWDNLLLACSTCNQNKGVHFDILGDKVEYENSEENIRNINVSSAVYDSIEIPKMVNPEIIDPKGLIDFEKNGRITSQDERFSYTIQTCKIDRKFLNDERRSLLDILERDIESALIENNTIQEQTSEIGVIIKKFIRDAKDNSLQFLAFRDYAISNRWLNEIVKEKTG